MEDKDLTDEKLEEEVARGKRYSLITCGSYWGAWDEQEASQILFKSKEEAIAHIHQLLRNTVFEHYGSWKRCSLQEEHE